MTKFQEKIEAYLKAAYPLLLVETQEEIRAIHAIREVVQKTGEATYFEFDQAGGLIKVKSGQFNKEPEKINGTVGPDPNLLLNQLVTIKEEAVVVVKDYHTYLLPNSALVIRRLRSLLGQLKNNRVCVVFISPAMEVPKELEKDIQSVPFGLPTPEELGRLFKTMVKATVPAEQKNFQISEEQLELVLKSAAGMTHIAAENAFALALSDSGKRHSHKVVIDHEFITLIFEEKIANLKQSALEYIPMTSGFESVGGLQNLKDWVRARRKGFDPEARKLRLPYPRGVILAGLPGTGKTVSAMAIAHVFGFPLFKLDLGRIFGGVVGATEKNTRELIRLLEGIGAAVVLVDEMDKALPRAATGGQGDSGVSSRLLGSLLTWMSVKTCPVFLVGTLNRVEALDPALIRPGRFDERFMVDLPSAAERADIFRSLLVQKFGFGVDDEGVVSYDNRDLDIKPRELFDVTDKALILATDGATGAEIESLIQAALYKVLENPTEGMAIFYQHLLEAARNLEPQSKTSSEEVEKLRQLKGFLPAGEVKNKAAQKDRNVSLN